MLNCFVLFIFFFLESISLRKQTTFGDPATLSLKCCLKGEAKAYMHWDGILRLLPSVYLIQDGRRWSSASQNLNQAFMVPKPLLVHPSEVTGL